MKIESYFELNQYIHQIIQQWIEKKQTLLQNCYLNAISLHDLFKFNKIENKIYTKYGSWLIDGKKMAHAWNLVLINNKEYIIDLTYIYLSNYSKYKYTMNFIPKYFPNEGGYTFKKNSILKKNIDSINFDEIDFCFEDEFEYLNINDIKDIVIETLTKYY